MSLRVKRIYDEPHEDDGERILVDRIWPRGLSKEQAAIDAWMKEIAPSTPLRKWFGHDPARWNEFRKRYARELDDKSELVDALRRKARRSRVTLLYGAKDVEHNQAVALAEILQRAERRKGEATSIRTTGAGS